MTPTGDTPPSIPRMGLQMAVLDTYDDLSWFGRGPHENYWDRKTGAADGRYTRSLSAVVTRYVRPQVNANRSDTRWVAFQGEERGLLAIADSLLSVSAWPYTQRDLAAASHTHDLPNRDVGTVNLDWEQMGLGGNNTWSAKARPMPKYRLSNASYTYGFTLCPYRTDERSAETAARDPLPEEPK